MNIGGVAATDVTLPIASPTLVRAKVAAAPAGAAPLRGDQNVQITPPNGTPITAYNGITIEDDAPSLTKVDGPSPVSRGSVITLQGRWLLAPGTPGATITAGGAAPNGLPDVSVRVGGGPIWPVTPVNAYSNTEVSVKFGDQPVGLQADRGDATVTVSRAGTSAVSASVTWART